MKAPNKRPDVQLTGRDGTAFFILGRVAQALRKAGADEEYIEKYHEEATAGDYDNLLKVTLDYVNGS